MESLAAQGMLLPVTSLSLPVLPLDMCQAPHNRDARSRGEGGKRLKASFSAEDVGYCLWLSLKVSWGKISQTIKRLLLPLTPQV